MRLELALRLQRARSKGWELCYRCTSPLDDAFCDGCGIEKRKRMGLPPPNHQYKDMKISRLRGSDCCAHCTGRLIGVPEPRGTREKESYGTLSSE